ncbi:MAG: acyl carrier protein [Ardenticatenaceae bacterium]|nr:acyl carrier protein [Anaerolineales bacterium]MCB8923776.1 acyl carrier protein [Ardenticatenaceae bacterium]MCB8990111.1 acyl carrier protein [Ardenticatenaceae bacterium]
MDRENILLGYIKDELLRGRKGDLKAVDDLLSNGIIDSLGILQMVAFIEERFNIQVPDEDVVFENFQSVKALSDYLAQY